MNLSSNVFEGCCFHLYSRKGFDLSVSLTTVVFATYPEPKYVQNTTLLFNPSPFLERCALYSRRRDFGVESHSLNSVGRKTVTKGVVVKNWGMVVITFTSVAVATSVLANGKQQFRVGYSKTIQEGPLTGRAYVMIARSNDKEPRLQIGRTGVPFFGRDFELLEATDVVPIDGTDLGTPLSSLSDIPTGEYFVQGFINIYSKFARTDGHVLWMHDDQWEGQHWERSPGNLYSVPRKVHLDSKVGYDIELVADQVILPIQLPSDTAWVKRFKFESELLTEFWGRPIYLGATVLLPRDYARETISYPVVYVQGHFSLRDPMHWEVGEDLYQAWVKDDFPRMIIVTFQDPTPYFDTSYSVNSVNVGPYGDAMLEELIPEVETRFRIISQPYARVLTGGSTGGWEALAMQIFHPNFFGGTFAYAPDPVTFTNVEGINIYEDVNAFYKQHDWRQVPIANTREIDGEIRLTSRQRNYFELVSGTRGRSGQQLDIWSAVYGPLDNNGYFEPLFDKWTGEINHTVAEYWRDNYDLLHHLKKNWATLGPKLINKLHIFCGDMDNYYLNVAVKELEQWMKETENPHYPGYFIWGDGKGHRFGREFSTEAERVRQMAEHVYRMRPEGTAAPWWQY